jgi:HPr kinase/phosphorylase
MSESLKPFHVHATCVSLNGQGVLIRGRPGSGKSELALRLIDMPGYGAGEDVFRGRLVADDQVRVEAKAGALWASPPEALQGLLELRGQGLLALPFAAEAKLALIVDLVPAGELERLPEPEALKAEIAGVSLPRIPLDGREPAAPAVIRAVLSGGLKSLP